VVYACIYVLFTIVYFFSRGTDENGNVRSAKLLLLGAAWR
jgi:hypothetical protein